MEKTHEEERNCLRCGRKLTDNVSIERNYGPVCYEKYLKQKKLSEQLEMEEVEE